MRVFVCVSVICLILMTAQPAFAAYETNPQVIWTEDEVRVKGEYVDLIFLRQELENFVAGREVYVTRWGGNITYVTTIENLENHSVYKYVEWSRDPENYINRAKLYLPILDNVYEILENVFGPIKENERVRQEVLYEFMGGGFAGYPIRLGPYPYPQVLVESVWEPPTDPAPHIEVRVINEYDYEFVLGHVHEMTHNFAKFAPFVEQFASFGEAYIAEKLGGGPWDRWGGIYHVKTP